jgi:hypothetical protein
MALRSLGIADRQAVIDWWSLAEQRMQTSGAIRARRSTLWR